MRDIVKDLVISKFDLTSLILNKRNLSKEELQEIRNNLILANNLRNQLRLDSNLDCSLEIEQIQECVARIR